MGARLRGEAWYVRVNIGGKRVEAPLGIYGGEVNGRKAEAAAKKRAAQLKEQHAEKKTLEKHGALPKTTEQVRMLFTDWWMTYRTTHSIAEKNEDTRKRDDEIMVHWMPFFEGKWLDEITKIDCTRAYNSRSHAFTAHKRKTKTRLTRGTVLRECRLVHGIFRQAVENKKVTGLTENPMKGVGTLKKGEREPSRAHRVLSEEDQPKLIAAMQTPVKDATGHMVRMDERYVRFVEFMLEVGIRIDELLNEFFADNGEYIHVQGKFSKERDVRLTRKGRRLLDEQWADQGHERSRRPAGGGPWWQNEQRFREVMAKACERAGIMHLSPHDLRHTFGHRYLVRGGDIYDLSKILGHSSVAVTERHYAYLRKEDVGAKMLAVMEAPVV